MLCIVGGLPGTGKTTLSQQIARERREVHLRIDFIEQALREAGVPVNGPEGYIVAYHLAEHNLCLGMRVVVDSVNPLNITRSAWRDVAARAGVAFVGASLVDR
jgi:predicted kinase